jgi:hypothetical protein
MLKKLKQKSNLSKECSRQEGFFPGALFVVVTIAGIAIKLAVHKIETWGHG